MEGHLQPLGVSGGLTRPPGQEELSPGLPRVPPVGPLLKGPVALASETGVGGVSGLPPRFTLLPVGDEGPPGTSLPRDHVLHSAPRVSRSWVPEHPTNLPVLATICCDQHPSPPIRTLGGSMAPDLCLQGWTHGRVRAQSDAEEKERRGQGGKGGGLQDTGVGYCLLPHWSPLLSPAATFQGCSF